MTIEELIAGWDSGDGKPYKGSLFDRAAYEANPDSPACMCAQGQVLHYVAGWDVERLASVNPSEADKAVAKELGISLGHSILLRHVNDKADGAPAIVLTQPEKVLGEHAQLVLAFFKHLDSMDAATGAAAWAAAWDAARAAAWAATGAAAWAAAWDAARAAAWDAARAAAWAAAWDAARAAAWDAARAAAWAAAWDATGAATGAATGDAAWAATGAATGAATEIQGHKILAEQGKQLFFLPMFGFETIEALREYAQ